MKKIIPFFLILLLATFLRFFRLGSVPPELNRDEASLGYTAYSILLTGKEEHGRPWPIQIESFGDWKLPLYVYTLIPFIAAFGLEPWVVRLPSALAGIGIVWMSRHFILLLLNKKPGKEVLSLAVPLLLAVSPWAIHFSHVAYEAHLSLFLFFLGLCGVLWVVQQFEEKKKRFWGVLTLSLAGWAITLLGYHSYQVFIPLFTIGMTFLFWKTWKAFFAGENKKILLVCFFPYLIVGLILILSGVRGANSVKFSGLSIFNTQSYAKQVGDKRAYFRSLTSPAALFVANKYDFVADQIEKNFFDLISPQFVFVKGGDNHAHNITGYGNLYSFLFFGLVVGIAQIFIRRERWLNLLGIWTVAASVAPMITFSANHTTRFSPGFIAVEILSAYGWFIIVQKIKEISSSSIFKIVLSVLAMGFFYYALQFLIYYFVIFPRKDMTHWSWQMRSIVYMVDTVKNDYDQIIIQGEESSPYIYFLFYLKVDPRTLSERVEYYPLDKEGFRHVKRFDTITFEKVNWKIENYQNKKMLFVVSEQEIPDYNRSHEDFSLKVLLQNPDVERKIELWQYLPTSKK